MSKAGKRSRRRQQKKETPLGPSSAGVCPVGDDLVLWRFVAGEIRNAPRLLCGLLSKAKASGQIVSGV